MGKSLHLSFSLLALSFVFLLTPLITRAATTDCTKVPILLMPWCLAGNVFSAPSASPSTVPANTGTGRISPISGAQAAQTTSLSPAQAQRDTEYTQLLRDSSATGQAKFMQNSSACATARGDGYGCTALQTRDYFINNGGSQAPAVAPVGQPVPATASTYQPSTPASKPPVLTGSGAWDCSSDAYLYTQSKCIQHNKDLCISPYGEYKLSSCTPVDRGESALEASTWSVPATESAKPTSALGQSAPTTGPALPNASSIQTPSPLTPAQGDCQDQYTYGAKGIAGNPSWLKACLSGATQTTAPNALGSTAPAGISQMAHDYCTSKNYATNGGINVAQCDAEQQKIFLSTGTVGGTAPASAQNGLSPLEQKLRDCDGQDDSQGCRDYVNAQNAYRAPVMSSGNAVGTLQQKLLACDDTNDVQGCRDHVNAQNTYQASAPVMEQGRPVDQAGLSNMQQTESNPNCHTGLLSFLNGNWNGCTGTSAQSQSTPAAPTAQIANNAGIAAQGGDQGSAGDYYANTPGIGALPQNAPSQGNPFSGIGNPFSGVWTTVSGWFGGGNQTTQIPATAQLPPIPARPIPSSDQTNNTEIQTTDGVTVSPYQQITPGDGTQIRNVTGAPLPETTGGIQPSGEVPGDIQSVGSPYEINRTSNNYGAPLNAYNDDEFTAPENTSATGGYNNFNNQELMQFLNNYQPATLDSGYSLFYQPTNNGVDLFQGGGYDFNSSPSFDPVPQAPAQSNWWDSWLGGDDSYVGPSRQLSQVAPASGVFSDQSLVASVLQALGHAY